MIEWCIEPLLLLNLYDFYAQHVFAINESRLS